MNLTVGEMSILLSKIDERTINIQDDISELKSDLRLAVTSLSASIKESDEKNDRKIVELKKTYVERVEFEPVKKFVYGIVMFVFITVVGGGMTMMLQSKSSINPTVKSAVETVSPGLLITPSH